MPEIPDIGVRDINIREIKPNPIFDLGTPRILVPSPPVTTYLRKPIVAYPGCVEHADAIEDDQKMIQCDGQIPSYEPLNFEPEQMTITRPASVPAAATAGAAVIHSICVQRGGSPDCRT